MPEAQGMGRVVGVPGHTKPPGHVRHMEFASKNPGGHTQSSTELAPGDNVMKFGGQDDG